MQQAKVRMAGLVLVANLCIISLAAAQQPPIKIGEINSYSAIAAFTHP